MTANNHIIQKVVLEIETNSMKVANSLKNNSNAFIQNELLPLIEKELNGLHVGENETLQIEKINISVDAKASNVDYTFKPEFKEEVKNQLQKKIQNAIKESQLKTDNTPNESIALVSETGKKRNTLLYFLNHGRMPWWNSKLSSETFFNDENLVAIVDDPDFKQQFRTIVSKKEVQKRLLNQFSNYQIALLLSSQNEKNSQNKITIITASAILKQLSIEPVHFKKEFWTLFFNYLSSFDDESIFSFYTEKLKSWSLSFSDFVTELSDIVPMNSSLLSNSSKGKKQSIDYTNANKAKDSVSEIQNLSEPKNLETKSTSSIENVENPIVNKGQLNDKEDKVQLENSTSTENQKNPEHDNARIKKDDFVQNEPDNKTTNAENNMVSEEKFTENNLRKEATEQASSQNENSLLSEENYTSSDLLKKGIYMENAGLIILHPFLKMLFKNCNLLDENNIIINKELAVHILHYAATKKEYDYEHTMLFEKFLCGIPLEYPIKREINIEEYQKINVEELLIDVVSHWSALKKSSTDILRIEFLQREGKLDLLDSNPKLAIEKKTQDILLDKIPWNISIVKIPWLEKLIYTEW